MTSTQYIKINIGQLTQEELANIVRELKDLWKWRENIKPSPDMKVTRDSKGIYYIHLNGVALQSIIYHCKDIPKLSLDNKKDMPPMPPDFLLY